MIRLAIAMIKYNPVKKENKMKWERIDIETKRAKITGGWLVKTGPWWSRSICFVADNVHKWKL